MTNANRNVALQFYYTSCRRGLSGHAGFQTRAQSSGISSEERREIEAESLYYPPRDAPREPNAREIKRFPVAFRTVTLASGRDAVMRSVYTGKDYSGRWGNYFVHVLVLDGADMERQGLDLLDLYAWSGWVGGLSEQEDGRDPEVLPPVPLDKLELEAEPDLSPGGIQELLGEPGRAATLAAMVRAVFQGTHDSRSVVIRERSAGEGVLWIAGVRLAFPTACRRLLGCSTFQFDPRTASALNATFGQTDFHFSDAERDYQFYVFDFVTGRHSDVSEDSAGDYAGTLSEWLASEPERVKDFHAHAERFGGNAIGPELVNVLRLYRLNRGEGRHLAMADLRDALEFADRHAPPDVLSGVIEATGRGGGAGYLDESNPPGDWALVIRFLSGQARKADNAKYDAYAWRAWVRAFDVFVLKRRGGADAWQVLRDLRRDRLDRLNSVPGLLKGEGQFLSDGQVNAVLEIAPELDAEALHFVMRELCDICRLAGGTSVHERREVRSLVESVLEGHRLAPGGVPDLAWALKAFRTEDGRPAIHELREVLHHVIGHVATTASDADAARSVEQTASRTRVGTRTIPGPLAVCRGLGRSLFEVVGQSDDRLKLLGAVCRDPRFAGAKQHLTEEVLHEEWRASLEGAPDKVRRHEEYQQQVLRSGSHLTRSLRNRMARTLFDGLPRREQDKQARSWLDSGDVRGFPDAFAKVVLERVSRAVKFSARDRRSDRLAKKIANARDGIVLPRIELRTAVRALAVGGKARIRWNGVTEPTYREFVAEAVTALRSVPSTPQHYGGLLLSVVRVKYIDAFLEIYCAHLRRHVRADAVDVGFWLWLPTGRSKALSALLPGGRETILDALARRIASLRKKRRERVWALLEDMQRGEKSLDGEKLEAFRSRCEVASAKANWLFRMLRIPRVKE